MPDIPETYLNPVYPRSFPDPFVLKFCGEYFAYSTGFAPGGDVFAILHSRDLVNWSEAGAAMRPLADSPPFYWAPEVTYHNGKFYLYYSVGNETLMEIRVAVSRRPDGEFEEPGKRLTHEDFAIDPHVFIDDDGRRYMFYATDFLEHTHIGTGVVVDEMTDWFTLAGNPRPVTRAKYDWQVYDPNRAEKGGVRWHTVEGPTVLKRKGLYYEMFSGGNWQNTTYGVSFAVSDSIDNPNEWEQFSNDEAILPIVRTIPEQVVGPGHNSVVRGPNNRELFCVYHRWINDHRVLAIDRMDFAGRRIFVNGATTTPQPAPFKPAISNPFTADESSQLDVIGEWIMSATSAISSPDGECELVCPVPGGGILCEFSFRVIENNAKAGRMGFRLYNAQSTAFEFSIAAAENKIAVSRGGSEQVDTFDLPTDFEFQAFHLVRLEVDGSRFKLKIDETELNNYDFFLPISAISLFTNNIRGEFTGFQLTEGFEDLFDGSPDIESHQIVTLGGTGESRIVDRELIVSPLNASEYTIGKGSSYGSLEFAANTRLEKEQAEDFEFGLLLLSDVDEIFRLRILASRRLFRIEGASSIAEIPFPDGFDPKKHHQFRILRVGSTTITYLEDVILDERQISDAPARPAVYCRNSVIALDMLRLTQLGR